ncbi:PREDICTED: OTU domain-containing protein 3-like [Priapulus caudatus]|uniref:OTU domain-containing protein 3-like n=1 Tax=Priapulus caudatus TaxID=37621 RepID=A0ABM1DSK2_PRICU|nr:PREDICTED: OTU domain-containing protein 3-like [Priapulus caudatus]XP_014662921.1 PREDICTED: OTU domain-containing protein 3-like [Priapulus caudatus]XP_014662922.1 PREDICTED: OTU domain-containing protein 3-like [Priapulus caudatus]XP_014662923.1 PREDICTED: OTU domain-containing protein 3-like [Priapulus caudatus]
MSGKKERERVVVHKQQRLCDMARKREERSIKSAHRRERAVKLGGMWSYFDDDNNFVKFANQLMTMGLCLREIPGDGNCLFRSLADQLEGHHRHHMKHRLETVDYIGAHRKDFEPFIEEPFERYVSNLRKPGTYAGNDVIVGFARNHGLHVVIHQLNLPLWKIHGSEKSGCRELHISYHNGDHYSSVRRIGDRSEAPANIRLMTAEPPRLREKERHSKSSEKVSREANEEVRDSDPPCGSYHPAVPYPQHGTVLPPGDASLSYTTPDGHTIFPDEHGVAKAVRGVSDIARYIMAETGFENQANVESLLVDMEFDVDMTISHIEQLKELAPASTPTSPSTRPSASAPRPSPLPCQDALPSPTSDLGMNRSSDASSPVSPSSESASVASVQTNDSGIWSHDSPSRTLSPCETDSTSRVSSGYGSHSSRASGAKPKVKALTSKQRKEQARMEKKKKQEERHRQKGKGEMNTSLGNDDTDMVIIKEVKLLKI